MLHAEEVLPSAVLPALLQMAGIVEASLSQQQSNVTICPAMSIPGMWVAGESALWNVEGA